MPIALSVKDISLSYGKTQVLKGCSLDVEENEIFGLLGPNGAGKSSLMRVITGQARPQNGQVGYWGKDLSYAISEIKKFIGLVPQDYSFAFDFTVLENLRYFSKLYDFSGDELEKKVESQISSFLLGGKRDAVASNLSGGYKRLLNFALSTLHSPKLLLLDEPTVGLDPDIRFTVWQIIKQMRDQGKTIILTTHYLEEATYLCDRLAIIYAGQILVLGTPTELIAKYGGDTTIFVKLSIPAASLENSVKKIKGIISAQANGKVLVVNCSPIDVLRVITSLGTFIAREDLTVQETYVKEPTMDDVFKALVGREIGVK
ncbi:MAG: ABC transporter ATP-binding protein [Candidatus Micrarchaeota archaeon]